MSYYGPPQQYPPRQYPMQPYPYPQQPPVGGPSQAQPSQSLFTDPKVIIGTALGIIGGLMLMISVFPGYVSVCQTGTFGYSYSVCVSANPGGVSYMGSSHDLGNEFVYGYLLIVFGIMVLIFGSLAPIVREKGMATMTWISGMAGLIMAILLLLHFMLRVVASMGSPISSSYNYSVLPSIGFFIAIIGAVLGLVGGLMLGKQIAQMQQYAMPQAPMGAPYEVQPQYRPRQPPSY